MIKEQRILVTGSKGQLGFDCIKELNNRGYTNIFSTDKSELDITNKTDVDNYFYQVKPDIVIHCAAWTNVDAAEKNISKVYDVNAYATKYIASICKKIGAKLVYISTDYVFNGSGIRPFEIYDKKDGLSVYGKSKSLGEDYVLETLEKYFIIRISWAFGINGNNFVKTMLKLATSGLQEISVVDDEIGSVTYTKDLAKLICDMIKTSKFGIYHATNEGYISWYQFAKKIFELKNIDITIKPVSTKEYSQLVTNQAVRPLNSRLSKDSLEQAGFLRLPQWEDALNRYLKEELLYE